MEDYNLQIKALQVRKFESSVIFVALENIGKMISDWKQNHYKVVKVVHVQLLETYPRLHGLYYHTARFDKDYIEL